MSTRRRGVQLSERQAVEITGFSADQLHRLVADRDATSRAAIPAPLDGPPYVWDKPAFNRWALRMGLRTHRGVRVIGYTGLAELLGVNEQSLRKLATTRDRHIVDEGAAWPTDLPKPRFEYKPGDAGYLHGGPRVLFDLDVAQRWARQTGRLRD